MQSQQRREGGREGGCDGGGEETEICNRSILKFLLEY